jgi:hypothetical protein
VWQHVAATYSRKYGAIVALLVLLLLLLLLPLLAARPQHPYTREKLS